MVKYTKPALTFEKQIELLKNRGLIINNEQRTVRHLANVSYYRMSAYMLPFKEVDVNGCLLDKFKEGATWDNVYDLYVSSG
mgnify:FL=1